MLEEGLYDLLSSDQTLIGLVAGRITPVILPKTPVLPALTFFTLSGTDDVALDNSATMLTSIEIDAWAMTYLEAKSIQSALHDLLDGYTGTLSDGTAVKSTTSDDNPDLFEKDSLYYRTSMTFHFLT